VTAAAGWLLAIDTATTTIVVAAGTAGGEVLAADTFEGRYRHSQELLPAVDRLIAAEGLHLRDLAGVIVGTGPGAFTGLRVGLATAKTLAHELGVPVAGIATSDALLAAADGPSRLWLPSGPRDLLRIERAGVPEVVASDRAEVADSDIAVDLDGRAPAAALEHGRQALAALAATLLRHGAARLEAGEVDDPERLVPAYGVQPRGVLGVPADGGVAWSRDPR
jgi:tRNA threonylcarbamoyl adenosine modification protein YeaZ